VCDIFLPQKKTQKKSAKNTKPVVSTILNKKDKKPPHYLPPKL
jgi:hypothetical protein